MRAFLLVAVAGCWTGRAGEADAVANAERAPAPSRSNGFKLRLERTACMGRCPIYTLVIHGDGNVDWLGRENVLAVGARRGHVTNDELRALERELARVRFFERDEYGELPVTPQCTTQNGTTTCSMGASFSICSDTSHTVITVTREHKTHTVDNQNCSEADELAGLEALIDRIANVPAWVGE